MGRFDLLAVQGTHKSPLEHHISKASILSAQPSLWSNSHMSAWLQEKPGEGNANPLQDSCLEHLMGRGDWRASLWGHKESDMTEQLSTEKPSFGLYWPLLAKWCLCFIVHCLGLSSLSFQGVRALSSWLQSTSTVILKPKKIKSVTASTFSPSIWQGVMGPDALVLILWMLSLKQNFSPSVSYFTFIKRLFISSLISSISMVLHAHLRWLIFLLAILNNACVSCSPAFHMMYPAYKLNKQGDNIQPWYTPFLILNQSIVPCPVLTVAFWPTGRFLRRQIR